MKRIPPNKTPEEIAIKICEDYHVHELKYVCDKYHVSEPTVISIYRNHGFVKSRRKHVIDEMYFHNIDTVNKAYILGFFMADVSISKTIQRNHFANRITLNISYKDRDILTQMLQDMQSDIKIEDYIPKGSYSTNIMSRIVINSMQMCRDLATYGIVERRTPIKCIPEKLQAEMLPHFTRGLFDGDGSCIIHNRKQKAVSFTSQSLTLLQQLKDMFILLGCKSVATIYKESNNKNAYAVQWHCKDDIDIWYNYMYPEGDYLYLSRKREKFLT